MMDVGDRVIVTDKHETTNGELVGVKGKVLHVDEDSRYPITVSLNNGKLEAFTKDELTIIESEDE
ncbi:hypothetical protein JUJ52_02530 [Virgibacillus sp. AGTR]|uniref:hypothetical protein n=1 Tax=Virgibacillus sp. AGTR TaxID=2812055 RepID=UPI001D1607D4|nr:hypothetical protein [Virgibacillus sp. AGTR]MCC2248835.1 hypothetical protein [Virgibacillus sp. AGTR]